MRRLLLFPALLLTLNALSSLAAGQSGATTTVTANPATVTVGGSVGLTATVQPENVSVSSGHALTKPTGSITFLDGSTALDGTPAALTPNTLVSGTFPQEFGTPDTTLTMPSILIPQELAGDLNGDGIPDLLVYTYASSSQTLSAQAFLSNGKGGHTPGALQTLSIATSGAPYLTVSYVPALVDLNGDGKLDLLYGIQVAYGNGDGTFAAPITVSSLSSGFVTAYAADLNGDGKTDLLAVNTTSWPGLQLSITVFLNQGGGSFTSAGTFLISSGAGMHIYVYPPTFIDLNGDGKLDLVLQWNGVAMGAPEVDVLLNSGNGAFGSPSGLTVPSPPNIGEQCASYQTGFGDVNGDGRQDLILGTCDDYGYSDAIVLLGNGNGTFESPLFFALPTPPNVVIPIVPNFIVQDVNLDGKLDLVFGSGRLALGNGDGTFISSAPLFSLPANPYYYPLLQMQLAGNPAPSLIFLPLSVTPAPAAVFTPQTGSSASLSLTTLAVGTHSISAKYSGDTNYLPDNSAGVTVTVSQAASVTAAKSSVNPSFAGQSVTLTANVTSVGPLPTGNVTFASGSTILGAVALSGGTATYTTSFKTVGTQSITVSYSGDANTQASSASLSQVVNGAFSLGSPITTLSVASGQTVNIPIVVSSVTGFSGQVNFACESLPTNASCGFSPATVTLAGTPTSVSTVPTMLSVHTAATTASQLQPGTAAYGLAFAGLLLFWPARRSRPRMLAMLICALAFATLGLCGCGSGSSPAAQAAPGTYDFTVTASSGNVQAQATYTLVVH
jgi:hypothetical protein